MIAKSDHSIVPEHELMSESDAKKVIDELNISGVENLPKIFESDPQSIRLGAKIGQVIKISRVEGENSYLYYRTVVEG